jgi:hypothetical protein
MIPQVKTNISPQNMSPPMETKMSPQVETKDDPTNGRQKMSPQDCERSRLDMIELIAPSSFK